MTEFFGNLMLFLLFLYEYYNTKKKGVALAARFTFTVRRSASGPAKRRPGPHARAPYFLFIFF